MSIITGDLLYDVICIIVATLSFLFFYSKWSFQYWKDRGVPNFDPQFIWGNLSPPHRRQVSSGEEIANLYKRAKDKGYKHLGFYNTVSPIYMPLDLDLLKLILTKDFNHFVDRGIYYNEKDEPISAHLFAIGGKKWRNLRTKFTPTFTSGKMRQMFQTIADCGIQLEKYLVQELKHHEPIDIKDILGKYSTDIIGSCAFGLECNSFKDPDNPFRKMGKRIANRTRLESLKSSMSSNFPNLGKFFGFTTFDKTISDFFSKVVIDSVNYREKNKVHRSDFLQLLIEIKNNNATEKHVGDGTSLTINEMIAQSFVFFFAGFETSSTTMSFALYEISKNPVIQQKMRDEIILVLNKYNGKVTYDALNDLKYMSQVIDETLRMYPPVPFITRICVEDYDVPNMDLKIKKGIRVFIPIKGIHYDEEYYPNSSVFDPERFSDEKKHDRNQYSFMPFGEGPRICIGMRFGIMQTKVGLLTILKNFNVTLNKKTLQPLTFSVNSFIPQVNGGIWLDMIKINHEKINEMPVDL